ncbi:peroxisomal assembly protein [Thoreauomyces humboldtii]|nr:peroxisomal assembly protein [Thoreauomyces humboldtii]
MAHNSAGSSQLSGNSESHRLAYFKVTGIRLAATAQPSDKELRDVQSYVDPTATMILQTGVVNSRVPPGQQDYSVTRFTSPARPTGTESEVTALMSTCLHPISAALGLSCNMLFHGPRGAGKRSIVHAVSKKLGVHFIEVNIYDVVSDTDAKTEAFLSVHFDKAAAMAPCVLVLRHIDALIKSGSGASPDQNGGPIAAGMLSRGMHSIAESFRKHGQMVFVAATTADIDKVPEEVQGLFRHQYQVESPSEVARLHVLKSLTQSMPLSLEVNLSTLAMQTAALVAVDLVDVVARAAHVATTRVRRELETSGQRVSERDLLEACVPVTSDDFANALDLVRSSHSDSIGAPKIPNVKWDDVGGLSHVKDNIYDTIQLPLEHPELFSSGMKKRSGILLYGPPGTGKTLVAKAVATNFALNFMSVKGPELLNMYIGESEANVRKVFQRARDARPCVVFFDELDSVAPKRGEKGDSGGVMDRIVSQLLAEIDGMGGGSDVFVIGATNRPDLLDPALLRPGRFDKLLYLGVSETHDAQLNILEALTRKFRLHPSLSLRTIAESCPFNYTGADFYALCSDAMLKAIIRTIDVVDRKIAELNRTGPHEGRPHVITPPYYLENMAVEEDSFVMVEEGDFLRALEELIPSVGPAELERYKEVRKKFETVEDSPTGNAKDKGKGKGNEERDAGISTQKGVGKKRDKGKGKAKYVDDDNSSAEVMYHDAIEASPKRS